MIDGTSLGAATDKNGKYLIEDLKEGEYDITVSYIGYKDYKKLPKSTPTSNLSRI